MPIAEPTDLEFLAPHSLLSEEKPLESQAEFDEPGLGQKPVEYPHYRYLEPKE